MEVGKVLMCEACRLRFTGQYEAEIHAAIAYG